VFTDAYNSGVLISWWQSISITFFWFHVKFEGRLFISVLRNKTTLYEKIGVQNRRVFKKVQKAQNFQKPPPPRMSLNTEDFLRSQSLRALFFKTEMYNPSLNSTWRKIQCVPIESYQTWSINVLCASLSTTLSPKTATDSSALKVGECIHRN
jgi:hypothetical protein